MSDISNRTIVALLAVALVVSVAGTMYSVSELGQVSTVFRLMGAVVDDDTGNVTLNISEVAGLVVHHKAADFGTGSIENGDDNHCAMRTGGAKVGTSGSWSSNDTFADDPADGTIGINMAFDGENLGSQNAHSANCGSKFNSSEDLQDVFHALENTGNVPLKIDAEWDQMYSGAGPEGAWNNSCAFLTGIDDDDGTNGCALGGFSTDSDVPVRFALMGLASQTHANKTYIDSQYASESGVADASVSTPNGAGYIANLVDGGQPFIPELSYEDDRDEAIVGFGVIIPYNARPGARKAIIRYTGNSI